MSLAVPTGYIYEPQVDDYDVRKIEHWLVTPDGKRINMDFDPYRYMTDEDVARFIALGMPTRSRLGIDSPIYSEDLVRLAGQVAPAEVAL